MITLHAILPILMLVEPSLFTWDEMAGKVEAAGDLTRGTTVFDRRTPRQWRPNMEVAQSIDAESAREAFYNCLEFAAQEL